MAVVAYSPHGFSAIVVTGSYHDVEIRRSQITGEPL